MSAHRHQRRHDHDQDHHGRRHPAREDAGVAEDNSAVIAQMGPAVPGPAPAADPGGPMTDMPDWAADIGEEEGAAPAAALGGAGAALALAPTPQAPAVAATGVEEGGAAVGAPSGGVAPAEEEPGLVCAATLAQLDAILPPGLGVSLAAKGSVAVAFGVEAGVTLKLVNDGAGMLEVTTTGDGAVNYGVGVGVTVGSGGMEVGIEGALTAQVERVHKLPWADFVTLEVLASLATAPMPDVLESMLGGRDLSAYLMKATNGVGVSGEAAADAGIPGTGLAAKMSNDSAAGLSIGVEYEELAKDGVRKGTYSISGSMETLMGAAGEFEDAGIDLDLAYGGSGTVSVEVPFVETHGVEAYGLPYIKAEMEPTAGVNGYTGKVGGSVEAGPDHAVVEAHATIASGMDLWDDVLGGPVARAIGTVVDTEVNGEMTLGLEVDLSGVMNATTGIAEDVLSWVVTGVAPDPIKDLVPELMGVLQTTAPTLGVELELLNVGLEGEGNVRAGGKLELGAGIGGKVLYEREDVFDELGVKPTLPNILGYLRGSAPAAA